MPGPTKVLFVKPSVKTIIQGKDLPLGILHLSAFLKKEFVDDVAVKFINFRVAKKPWQRLRAEMRDFRPDIVGISLMTFEESFLNECIDACRNISKDCLIITGGPHPTVNYENILKRYPLDLAVIGEGERVLANIVRTLKGRGDVKSLKGVAYKNEGGGVTFNGREDFIEDMNRMPYADYELAGIENYWGYHTQMNFLLADIKYVPIMSSRACPYGCAYCHNIFGKTVRRRSPEHFVGEMKMLYDKYGVREFHIVDDIFNLDRPRMHEILRMIIDSGMKLKIAFPNALRGDIMTEEDLLLLKEAGAYMITLSIESASPRIQSIINKNLKIDRVIENINFANRIGLLTKGYFMLGFPSETVDEINQTIDLAVGSTLDMAAFFAVTPFYGTDLYKMATSEWPGVMRDNYGGYYEKSYYEMATGVNLRKIQKSAYARFYSARRLATLFRKTPIKYYLPYQFMKAVLNVLRI